MKDFLCPKKSSLKDDSNGTKNETDKRILWFFMIGQSFVKSIGVPPGAGAKLAGRRPAGKELITNQEGNRSCYVKYKNSNQRKALKASNQEMSKSENP